MTAPATGDYLQRADAQLHALLRALNLFDGFTCSIVDRELRVTRYGATPRTETVTCAPRPSDGDRLWFWTSARRPLGEADRIQDSALALAAHMPPKP
ncbi:hypothetical protein [Actinomadura geliboluensis]|uniref:hypothetical protein n=1 Tax=Actinomadura geliboluensis TaxID=882440 RepID=UPI00371B0316